MRTWIIGAGGLFGSALRRATLDPFLGQPVPWDTPSAAASVLQGSLEKFSAQLEDRPPDEKWCIAWAAGQATTSSTSEQTHRELDLFTQFIEMLRQQPPPGRGGLLVTSSAGGAYAGSSDPPFTSSSAPHPLGPYGELKLSQEQVAQALSPHMPVVITRVSNLYGPGQDLGKLQGVISRLALAAVTREPITMFVPLDTMRDYIYTDDAATRALHWAHRGITDQRSLTTIVASGQPETLGHVISLMNDITRVRIPIASGVHASASAQARDLRLSPDLDDTIRGFPLTPLPVGMKRVFMDIRQRHASARLVG